MRACVKKKDNMQTSSFLCAHCFLTATIIITHNQYVIYVCGCVIKKGAASSHVQSLLCTVVGQ